MATPRPAKPSAASASSAGSPRRRASRAAASKAPRALVVSAARSSASPRASRIGPASVFRVGERERLERALEALGGVLVSEPLERAAAGADEQVGDLVRVGRRRGLEQLSGDLLQVAVLAQRPQRLRGAAVQPRPAQDVELVVDGLAHERVRELEAPAGRRAPQQARAQDFVERGLGCGGLERRGAGQRARVELEPEHRGGGQQLVGGLAQPRQPDADRVAHALRDLGAVDETAQHLLGEERVAVGARVHLRGESADRRRFALEAAAHAALAGQQLSREGGNVFFFETSQPHAVERAVALQLGERAGQRAVAAELGVAVGAEDEQWRRPPRAQKEAGEQQRPVVGPVEVVDHQQQSALGGEPGERRVDRVEQPVARAGPRVLPGLQALGGADLAQRLGVGLERRQGLLPAAAEQHRRAALQHLAREAIGEPRLADARLACDQDDAVAAVRGHARPGRPQPHELGAAADELRVVGGQRDRSRRGRCVLERLDQLAGLARRRDRELRAQPLGEALARAHRRRAVAGCGEPLDQPPVRLLGERVERDLLAREPHRLGGLRARRHRLERLRQPLGVRAPRLVRPLVLEAVEDRPAARRERRGRVSAAQRRVERASVDRQTLAVERDRLAGRDHVIRCRAERAPQLAERGAQAGASRLVEHVGPERRREAAARVRAGVERQVGEDRARPPRRRRRELGAVALQPQPAGEIHPQHSPTVPDGELPAQADRGTFTQAERWASGGPARSPP